MMIKKRTQLVYGATTVELQKKLVKVLLISVEKMSAPKVIPSGVSSKNPRSTQVPTSSDSPERSLPLTHGMVNSSLSR
jgi:hypothetical protein